MTLRLVAGSERRKQMLQELRHLCRRALALGLPEERIEELAELLDGNGRDFDKWTAIVACGADPQEANALVKKFDRRVGMAKYWVNQIVAVWRRGGLNSDRIYFCRVKKVTRKFVELEDGTKWDEDGSAYPYNPHRSLHDIMCPAGNYDFIKAKQLAVVSAFKELMEDIEEKGETEVISAAPMLESALHAITEWCEKNNRPPPLRIVEWCEVEASLNKLQNEFNSGRRG